MQPIQIPFVRLAIAVLLSLAVTSPSIGRADSKGHVSDDFRVTPIVVVPGTDPEYEAFLREQLSLSYGSAESAYFSDEDRAAEEFKWRSMRERGYVPSNPQQASRFVDIVLSREVRPRDRVEADLGFAPGALDLGLPVTGLLPEYASDGRIHDVMTILEHPVLETVVVRERSLATEPRPRASKRIYAPPFDRDVNGHPALVRAFRTEDGLLGYTVLSVFREHDRLVALMVGSALLPEDPRLATLFALAEAL